MTTKNDFSLEENYLEKKKLTEMIFEKAKSESREVAKTALANYIDENSFLKFKTSTRMYDRYILGDSKVSIPTTYSLNSATKFIGYNSFADFCLQNFSDEKKTAHIEENKNEIEKSTDQFGFLQKTSGKKSYLKGGMTGLGIATIIGFSSYLGINGETSAECMYWKNTHYEKIICDEKVHPNIEKEPYDEQLFNYFHRIQPSDTTTYFRAGKPVIWYLKIDGEVEFYSSPGNHPITGKQLKPVTPYIVDKYIFANK